MSNTILTLSPSFFLSFFFLFYLSPSPLLPFCYSQHTISGIQATDSFPPFVN